MSNEIKWVVVLLVVIIAVVLVGWIVSAPSEEVPGDATGANTPSASGDDFDSLLDSGAEESLLLSDSDSQIVEAGDETVGDLGNIYDETSF